MADESLNAKVAVVTGGARGIGLAVAHWFLRHGHRVALLDIDAETLAQTAAQFTGAQAARVLTCTADVADTDAVAGAIAAVDARFGRIDALVNNAGVAVFKPILETSYAEWRRVLRDASRQTSQGR